MPLPITLIANEARKLMDKGVHDQHVLFAVLQPQFRTHYSRVREGIHLAKVT